MGLFSGLFKSSGTGKKSPNSGSSSYHRFNTHPSKHKDPAVRGAFKVGVKTGLNKKSR